MRHSLYAVPMRWRLLLIFLIFFLLIGATAKSPRILAWLHFPQPQKLKGILPPSILAEEKAPSSISILFESALQTL